MTSEAYRVLDILSNYADGRGILSRPHSVGDRFAGRVAWLESDDARRIPISAMTYDLDPANHLVMNIGFVTRPQLQRRGYCSMLLHAVLRRARAQSVESAVVSFGGYMTLYRAAQCRPKCMFYLGLCVPPFDPEMVDCMPPLPNLRIP